ncbi:response regulator [Candidatus Woesearchaeota archaeon]|nr:response regulator [Candidatus Woesearchaeota archaeon]
MDFEQGMKRYEGVNLERMVKQYSRILIVEDNPDERRELIESFVLEGYQRRNILEASTETQAKEVISEQNTSLDLIFSDINLPSETDSATAGERVLDAAIQLGLKKERVKLVLYTAYENYKRGIKLERRGADDYFSKNEDSEEDIFNRIATLLEDRIMWKQINTLIDMYKHIQDMTKGIAFKGPKLELLLETVATACISAMDAQDARVTMPREPFQEMANGNMSIRQLYPEHRINPNEMLDSDSGTLRRILPNATSIIIEDVSAYTGEIEDMFIQMGAKSIIGVPLIFGGVARGAFYVIRKESDEPGREYGFDEANLVLMNGMRDALMTGLSQLYNFYVTLFASQSILANLIDTLDFAGLQTAGGDTKKHVFRQKERAKEIADLLRAMYEDPDRYGMAREELRDEFDITLEEGYIIEWTSGMSDCGKAKIHHEILNKNDKLTDEEYSKMKGHPIEGYEIIWNESNKKMLPNGHLYFHIAEGVRHHHERWDGRTEDVDFPSYPGEKRGTDIPLPSRIAFIADSYDAMVSRRVYKKPMPIRWVVNELAKNAGHQFDPEIIRPFIRHRLGKWLKLDYESLYQEKMRLKEQDPNYGDDDHILEDYPLIDKIIQEHTAI